jgi:hypothetical protein
LSRQRASRGRLAVASAITLTAALAVLRVAGPLGRWTDRLPPRLSDAAFWQLVTDLSEPAGAFMSDNYVSNESTFQRVVPELTTSRSPSGAYVGVGPDQNFTYITALNPKIAFIVDIRRENMLLQLMYKALVELSSDRSDFLSRLFSRRTASVGTSPSAKDLLDALAGGVPDPDLFERNARAVADHLLIRRGLTLSHLDMASIRRAQRAFFEVGPDIRYGYPHRWFPTYAELILEADDQGKRHSYLSSEETFRQLKMMETNNLIVPVVGDFAGSKALKAVGQYLRDHGAIVRLFYTSNVEFYLFENRVWPRFLTNVGSMPLDDQSVFVRAYFNKPSGIPSRSGSRSATGVDPIKPTLTAYSQGLIRSYSDLIERSDSHRGE